MELIRGLHNLRDRHQGCVATIGTFDGVHTGHHAVLAQVKEKALALGLPSVVITFEPQPKEFFAQDKAPPRLTRFNEKMRLLMAADVDRVLCLTFNKRLRNMSADQFVKTILVDGLGIKHFVVGDDFRFGCDRRGDYTMLQGAGAQYGFSVVNTVTRVLNGQRVSSTRTRALLQANQLDEAAALLGRPYSVTSCVVHGQKLGRQLGVPTANLRIGRYPCPLVGVYAVDVTMPDGSYEPGVCNVGVRPTVNGLVPSLEVHLLAVAGSPNLYGQKLTVTFSKFLRAEQRFDGLDALKEQIFKDIEQARDFFGLSA
ncbi:MAG: bifunctional riboflavin kinase/FAD synthetase [Pontibacterium sp.]